MASIHSEYQRFLAFLGTRPVNEDVCKMANLVMTNLDYLAEVGTTRRARSSRLAPLAIQRLAVTSSQLLSEVNIGSNIQSFGRLHELKVGPFRGFMKEESFDLSQNITLVYGANGTGKSSFCEALEAAMLGSINEARAKRLNHHTYCNNARLRRHLQPKLLITKDGALPTEMIPNEDEHRFCFVEKNRLDDFARIAARTPSDQRQLIATLFGIDQFNEFVLGFNSSLDESLNLIPIKSQQLEFKRTQLAASTKIIHEYTAKLDSLSQNELELANRIHQGTTYQGCCDWLFGTSSQLGRLPYLNAILEKLPPPIYNLNRARLIQLLNNASNLWGEVSNTRRELTARAGEVSYSQLYQAVRSLAAGSNSCPACGTTLDRVAENPFTRAEAGLKQLADLAALQGKESSLRQKLHEELRVLLAEMHQCIHVAAIVCPQDLQIASLPLLPTIAEEGAWLSAWSDGDQRSWNTLLSLVAKIEKLDEESRLALTQRQSTVDERTRLESFRLEIERCRTLRDVVIGEYTNAQQLVAQFNSTNQVLINEVAEEVITLRHNQRIKAAYDVFLNEIQSYLSGLPARLLQGLAEKAKSLYNSFNRDDPPSDLLHALWLPIAESGKIEIEFASSLGERHDALLILSEGHIKCLGLAILLAKNLTQNCPVVIFDDVVNAIDDEHRNGIWRTLFEDGHLTGKQVILTSHAEEFLHRIQQELGAEQAKIIKRYKFLPHLGEHHLRIDSDPPTKNYVLLAQHALSIDEKRDALRHARPAIESVTDRIWTWLGRRMDGRLELKLGGPRAPWELQNKCIKLRSAFDKYPNKSDDTIAIMNAFNLLLNNGQSIEWGYLNGGTHDSQRDHEFDRATVKSIVEAVSALDDGLKKLQK